MLIQLAAHGFDERPAARDRADPISRARRKSALLARCFRDSGSQNPFNSLLNVTWQVSS